MEEKPLFQTTADAVDVDQVMAEIRRRVAARHGSSEAGNAATLARDLRETMLGSDVDDMGVEDCEVLPRDYVIDWRIPILGPIHAFVRRIVNAEIRRYLEPGLIRQTRFNRWVLRELQALQQENDALRRELASLREELGSNDS